MVDYLEIAQQALAEFHSAELPPVENPVCTPVMGKPEPEPQRWKPTSSTSLCQEPGGLFNVLEAKQGGAAIPLKYPDPNDLPARANWNERHFGPGKHRRLLAYIGHRVHCPTGTGTLLNVFRDRCDVDVGDLDANGVHRVRFYKPDEVEPIN